MATADGDVETKAYFRKYSIAIKLYLSLAAQQATPVAICPEGYSCSRAALLSFNRINDNLTQNVEGSDDGVSRASCAERQGGKEGLQYFKCVVCIDVSIHRDGVAGEEGNI